MKFGFISAALFPLHGSGNYQGKKCLLSVIRWLVDFTLQANVHKIGFLIILFPLLLDDFRNNNVRKTMHQFLVVVQFVDS